MQKRQFLASTASGAAWAALSSSALLSACATGGPQAAAAEHIYLGGPILTMHNAQPQVEAVAVSGT